MVTISHLSVRLGLVGAVVSETEATSLHQFNISDSSTYFIWSTCRFRLVDAIDQQHKIIGFFPMSDIRRPTSDS